MKQVHKFLYQLEYCPNPQVIRVHARVRFPKSDTLDMLDLNHNKKGKKRHPLYAALAKIQGLESADSDGYALQLAKANDMFDWDQLIPKVLAVIQTTMAGKRVLTPFGPPKYPTEALRSRDNF
jgi:hypothetical protein